MLVQKRQLGGLEGDCPDGQDLVQIEGVTLLDADTVALAKWEPWGGRLGLARIRVRVSRVGVKVSRVRVSRVRAWLDLAQMQEANLSDANRMAPAHWGPCLARWWRYRVC